MINGMPCRIGRTPVLQHTQKKTQLSEWLRLTELSPGDPGDKPHSGSSPEPERFLLSRPGESADDVMKSDAIAGHRLRRSIHLISTRYLIMITSELAQHKVVIPPPGNSHWNPKSRITKRLGQRLR
jgi:hypothetical protein